MCRRRTRRALAPWEPATAFTQRPVAPPDRTTGSRPRWSSLRFSSRSGRSVRRPSERPVRLVHPLGGSVDGNDVLGWRGAGLARLAALELPIAPGFVVSTAAWHLARLPGPSAA